MKANEFRLGNLVLLDNRINKPAEIRKVDFWFMKSMSFHLGMDNQPYDSEINDLYKPIPLTPEMLERAGFEFIEYDIPVWGLSYGNFDGEDYEGCLILEKDLEDNFYLVINGRKLIIKYLHQLQNAVYVLINKELEFNLDNLN